MRDVNEYCDVLDSRDIIERIEELQEERDDYMPHDPDEETTAAEAWAVENEADAEELAALLALQEEAEPYADDWQHGTTLIRDSYFETYAQELAEECGDMPGNLRWPLTCIDWKQAARELQQDYTSVTFARVTYWVR